MPIKFGIIYEIRNPTTMLVPYDELYASALEHFKAMEELGYDHLGFTEHHLDPDGHTPSPMVWCAVASVVTKRATIGTALSLIPFLGNPVKVAEDLATMDIISRGRIIFQAGMAHRPKEFDGLGVLKKERAGRSEEMMEIIRKCFTEDGFSYNGRYFKLKNVSITPKPLQKPHPPLYFAGTTFGSPMERVAQMGFNNAANVNVGGLRGRDVWVNWHNRWVEVARKYGRDPKEFKVSDIVLLHAAEDPERAWHKHKLGIMTALNAYRREGTGGNLPLMKTPEEIPNWQSFFQTPEDCVKSLRTNYGDAPPDLLHFRWGFWPGMPPEESLQYHRLMTQKVLPKLRDMKPWTERP